MLQAGQLEDDSPDSDLSEVRSRLGKAISDITKLANAMEALVLTVTPSAVESGRDIPVPDIGGYLSERVEHQEAS